MYAPLSTACKRRACWSKNKEGTMTVLQQRFLELLSAAIWQRPADESLFLEMDEAQWKTLAYNSSKQRVNALIVDGINTLPAHCRPPRPILLSLMLQTEKIERENLRIDQAVIQLQREHEAENLPFVLLKGQGNALFYPDPRHRTPGDIDLLFYRSGDYERANLRVQAPLDRENGFHTSYERDGIHIENHYLLTRFHNAEQDRRLNKELDDIIRNDGFAWAEIEGTNVRVLPAGFNDFYVFAHLFRHFVFIGVGIRQVCDWLLMLHAHRGQIDRDCFTKRAAAFGLLKPMRAFAHATVTYLGASPDLFPFDLGEAVPHSRFIIEDILKGGSFGLHHPNIKLRKSVWGARLERYKLSASRSLHILALSPGYCLRLFSAGLFVRLKLTLQGEK